MCLPSLRLRARKPLHVAFKDGEKKRPIQAQDLLERLERPKTSTGTFSDSHITDPQRREPQQGGEKSNTIGEGQEGKEGIWNVAMGGAGNRNNKTKPREEDMVN